MRKLLAGAAVVGIVALGAAPAFADDTLDCADFETPIKISQGYDPFSLDRDGDGVGCEGNPGDAVLTDLYADLRGDDSHETPKPELAQTGAWGPEEHPVRWIAGSAGLAVVGGAAYYIARKGGCQL